MEPIPDIGIKGTINIEIANVSRIPEFSFPLTYQIPQASPVSLNIGAPVIDLPGCVEFNRANKKSRQLVDDDENGNVVLCDGSMPSFNPIDFEPEQIILTKPAGVPVIPNTETVSYTHLTLPTKRIV